MVGTTPLLRRAKLEDAAHLTAIRRSAILELAPSVMGAERAESWAAAAGPDRVVRAIQAGEVWLAEQEEEPVGWVEIAGNRVEGLYVRPDRSRQRIGSVLLRHAETRIRRSGFRLVFLTASWNAEGFYLSQGYTALSARPPDEGTPMRKVLFDE